MKKKSPSLLKTLGKIVLVIGIVIVYAYGLQVTKVDLEKPQEAKRQEQLTNILQGLAHPDLITYEIDRISAEARILVPCTGTPPPEIPAEPGQPAIKLSSNCAEPGEAITVSGTGFNPNENVFIFFVPYSADPAAAVELKLTGNAVPTDSDGNFSKEVTLRKDRTSDKPQTVRVVVNRRVGSPKPSEALKQTWEKIVETVFLAFIATTLGVTLAVPISFLAARNLMLQVTSTLTKFMASLIIMPIGALLGYSIVSRLTEFGSQFPNGNAEAVLLFTAAPLVGLAVVQSAGGKNTFFKALGRWFIGVAIAAVAVVVLAKIGSVGRETGISLKHSLGGWSFVGNFILIFSDVILLGLPALGALLGAFAFSPISNRILEATVPRMSALTSKIVAVVLSVLAGAIVFGVIAATLNWFYEFGDVAQVVRTPATIGAVLFAALALAIDVNHPIPTGMFVYYVFRTIMNTLRSIEPLVMVVAFAVWVGIGPFAGVMALGLHTIVALGKLYSEQVENIATGPIEAITATGANRLQTIIYAVIPQIVPPYIAFTLYRWDINVRMSTIIGFGGGGGIGFLLSQNINLLKYRQASVNMIAIAIVVASLDYLSAKVREKIT